LILSSRHRPSLAHFAASNVLIAFDYDGTLAPIAPTPAAARMRPKTRRLLAAVARRYPCVVLSGRPLDDLTRHLRRVPVWHLVGDHGFESGFSPRAPGAVGTPGERGEVEAAPTSWREIRAMSPHVREWVTQLRQRLPATRGLVIEPKRHSVTIHYRQVRDRRRVRAAVADAVRDLPDARVVGGAAAVNIIPSRGPHKGIALQHARRAFACDTAIYVGDDETDEDAFRSAGPDQLLSIRVGTRQPSAAQYRLRSQMEVDELLEVLIELRVGRRQEAVGGGQ
jgi:trehalose 6-phosphate phosphatase